MVISYNEQVIGTCGHCGGPVTVHVGPWWGVFPPTPSCKSCGAIPMQNYGPVIPMQPKRKTVWSNDGTGNDLNKWQTSSGRYGCHYEGPPNGISGNHFNADEPKGSTYGV